MKGKDARRRARGMHALGQVNNRQHEGKMPRSFTSGTGGGGSAAAHDGCGVSHSNFFASSTCSGMK